MSEKPIALDAYNKLAPFYAAVVDTKPHNAYYERPATLSLLPDVAGKEVLDAGCGPGVYSEWLAKHDARVIGVDASPEMVKIAKQRLAGRADIREADLSRPLDFLDDGTFDLVVSPLVLDYIEDWRALFREFYRVLRPGGCFVFSVSHPVFEFFYFKTENYFATERVSAEWKGFSDTCILMPSIRRPFEEVLNPLIENNFRIDRILEPKVTSELAEADPKHFEELSKQPCFLCVRSFKV